jgi:hypothetical protein
MFYLNITANSLRSTTHIYAKLIAMLKNLLKISTQKKNVELTAMLKQNKWKCKR